MTDPDIREPLGFIGGTGPQGRGLAARWAMAGHRVHLGSRRLERATEAVTAIADRVDEDATIIPATNEEAVEAAEIVVVSVPFEAQEKALPGLRPLIGDKIVLNVVNPMEFDDKGPKAVPVEEGSAAEQCQALLPEARVVSAFHDVSSRRLLTTEEPLRTHVLICGDDRDATHRIAHLAAQIEGMWGVYCGPLRNSEYIENITPLILWINRTYDIQAGILIDGIQREEGRLHAHPEDGWT